MNQTEAQRIIAGRERREALSSRGRPVGTPAAQPAAYNPGRSVYMRQGTIDARRTGRPIGTSGYPSAAWQVGPDIVDRGLYNPVKDPAMAAAGFTGRQALSYAPQHRVGSYAFDSRQPPPDVDMSSPSQIAANRAAVQARLATLTGVNQVPAQVTSPVAPVAPGPMGPRLPSPLGQVPGTFGGDRRLALASGALPPAPVAPLPFMGGSRGMVANPEAGGLGVPNVAYRFPETLAEKKRKARQRREWDDFYGASLTREDLSRKLAARQRRAKKKKV